MYAQIIKKHVLPFFFTEYKNEWKQHKFQQQKNQKPKSYKNKEIFDIKDIDVNKILFSNKEKYDKYNPIKHFIGYNDNDVIKPLYLELPQMTGYIKILMDIKIKTKIKIKKHNNNISKG